MLTGCSNCQLLEAELRYQNQRVACLEQQLLHKDAEIHSLRATVQESLPAPATEKEIKPSEPTAEAIYKSTAVSRISIGRRTGGRDLDHDGKHDALGLLIIPHDYDGDPIKSPGEASIELYEILDSGLKHRIGAWSLSHEELRPNWRSSLFGLGYRVTLPWQSPPTISKLRAVVQFATLDGRTFEAERDFEISTTAKETPPQCQGGPPSTDSPPAEELIELEPLPTASHPSPPADSEIIETVDEDAPFAGEPKTDGPLLPTVSPIRYSGPPAMLLMPIPLR